MFEDFDPFAHTDRVEISVGRVFSMSDEEPEEILTLTIDGPLAKIEGADVGEIARPAGAEHRVSFKATRETRVHSWGASGVAEFIEMHVSGALTDAAILASFRYLVQKYTDVKRRLPPLTLDAARDAALWGIVRRESSISRERLVIVSEDEQAGGIYIFEIDGGVWRFTVTVERYKDLALVTRMKRTRKDT